MGLWCASTVLMTLLLASVVWGCGPDEVDLEDYNRFFTPDEIDELSYYAINYYTGVARHFNGGLSPSAELRIERSSGLVFGPTGASYRGDLLFVNHDDKFAEFDIITLLDFQQIMLTLGGHRDWFHTMSVEPGVTDTFHVEADRLPDGGHILLFPLQYKSFQDVIPPFFIGHLQTRFSAGRPASS